MVSNGFPGGILPMVAWTREMDEGEAVAVIIILGTFKPHSQRPRTVLSRKFQEIFAALKVNGSHSVSRTDMG